MDDIENTERMHVAGRDVEVRLFIRTEDRRDQSGPFEVENYVAYDAYRHVELLGDRFGRNAAFVVQEMPDDLLHDQQQCPFAVFVTHFAGPLLVFEFLDILVSER